MHTLLFRLSGPLQSWGESARFDLRPTQATPTKSACLGLICAAMGVPRHDTETLENLNGLRFGVRVDQPGRLLIDFQTVSQVVNRDGKIPQDTTPTDRHYLAGAVFLAGLEGEDKALLQRIQNALLKPKWLLFLGRKSCAPGESVWIKDGLVDSFLEQALRQYPLLRPEPYLQHTPFLEVENKTMGRPLMDTPLNFERKQYAPRLIQELPYQKVSMEE